MYLYCLSLGELVHFRYVFLAKRTTNAPRSALLLTGKNDITDIKVVPDEYFLYLSTHLESLVLELSMSGGFIGLVIMV